jgi:hypothetical protein
MPDPTAAAAATTTLLQGLPQVITAIGGLGTAAFGLLDASKSVLPINNIGFTRIKALVASLTPPEPRVDAAGKALPGVPPVNALPQKGVLDTLLANWINGTDLASQKSIAKSLVKLHLSAGNAALLADKTNVDVNLLKAVATKIVAGTPLVPAESDAYSRFDLIVTALLDEAYQHADDVYRNWTRVLAGAIAVALAVFAGAALYPQVATAEIRTTTDLWGNYLESKYFWQALLVGFLATPLAPIAKDLSSALATAVNTMQAIKK